MSFEFLFEFCKVLGWSDLWWQTVPGVRASNNSECSSTELCPSSLRDSGLRCRRPVTSYCCVTDMKCDDVRQIRRTAAM